MRRPLGMQGSTSRNSKLDSSTPRASISQNVTKEDIKNFVLKNRLTALVVDDSCVNRLCHKMLLNNLGVECQDVSNGQDAVALCREGAAFNVILMDMEMPIMNGPEVNFQPIIFNGPLPPIKPMAHFIELEAYCKMNGAHSIYMMGPRIGNMATRILRQLGVRSMIIGVSSHNKEWEVREFIESGLDYFFEKPLTRGKIINVLRELDDSLSA